MTAVPCPQCGATDAWVVISRADAYSRVATIEQADDGKVSIHYHGDTEYGDALETVGLRCAGCEWDCTGTEDEWRALFPKLDIIARCAELGVDKERLRQALDQGDNWGDMIHAFEYLTVLGVVADAMTNPREGWVEVEINRVEAMFRLLVDSGDMTPMATRQLGKLLRPEDEEST